jgi:Transposase DDE domain
MWKSQMVMRFQEGTVARENSRILRELPERSSPTTIPMRRMDCSTPILDQRLPELRHQKSVHHWQGATDPRWEHEHILEAVQRRLDEHPEKMRQRRETVEHPFGTIKARMGATHFLMKTLPRVASEMALHVLAYNLTRMMNIIGVQPLMAAMRAQ